MNENNEKHIERVSFLRDNKNNECVKAFAIINGKLQEVVGNKAINKLLTQFKKQENAKELTDLKGKLEIKHVYDPKEAAKGNYIVNDDVNEWLTSHENTFRVDNGKISRKSPYARKKVKRFSKFQKFGAISVATMAVLVTSILYGCAKKSSQNSQEELEDAITKNAKILESISDVEKSTIEEKVAPMTWEEYLSPEYNDMATQKVTAKKVMENLIETNIKTKTINGEEVTYGLTPNQAMAFYAYYNSTLLSNEELLAIFGDYRLTGNSDASKDIVNLSNDAVNTIQFSWVVAENESEMIIPSVEDQYVQEYITKYKNLWLEYKTSTTEKAKSAVKKRIEDALSDDFIENTNGVIDLYDHPAAHIILDTIPGLFTLVGDPLDESLNKTLVGTEAQNDVATDGGYINGKAVDKKEEDIIGTRGLVDVPCAVYIRRFDDFEQYRSELKTVKTVLDATEETTGNSEYDLITKDSFEYDTHDSHEGVIIPIMTDYVAKTYGLENIDLDMMIENLMQETIKKIQDDKINNPGPFDPNKNPAGGKKGDTYSETQKEVSVSGNIIPEDQKEAAEEKAAENVGAVTEEEGKKGAEEEQRIVNDVLNMKDSILQHYMSNGAGASEYNPTWANSEYSSVRNQYNAIKQAGINAYNEIKNNEQITTEGADNTPSHEDNPNQNQNQEQPSQPTEAPEIPVETPTEPTETPSTGNSTDEIEEGYDGPITTDPTDVWDPSTMGEEVESYSMEAVDLTEFYEAAEEETYDEGMQYSMKY